MHFIAPAEKTAVIFEELGFRYMGPIDGHNYDAVVDVLKTAKEFHGPVLVHVRTVKGKGFEPAERDARTFHGVGANSYEPNDGSKKSNPGAPPDIPRRLCRRAHFAGRKGSAHRRHYRGDAGRHGPREVRKTFPGSLLRRRYRRSARRLLRGRYGDQRTAPRLRDLLDLPAARLRPDRPRRRRAESPGRVLHGSRPVSSATTARRTWACTTSPTCARCPTLR